ncbi:hypothetical protein BGW36DRAFT_383794 [Talaromyces proteolyticus]|uniref:Zn(2)-C6 fungal-type domain-containing protein n=1 Tax=Talaromyces proteolyticus TaxID=1131652 RepID=A0AAD4KQE1_9EURO|nr:uncharacterized protein BGW36DRAFT_383794 [Talaromyces proteolyticus]KAH8693809.1 hypothetical protein BGW36DRAFT_383794 [Talaromyces proteolyticus]
MDGFSQRSSAALTSSSIRCCPHCEKVFNREIQYKRHVLYCLQAETKRKGRPRSCANCSTAKTKCSFDRPQCSRCVNKDLLCVYERAKKVGRGGDGRGEPMVFRTDGDSSLVRASSKGPETDVYDIPDSVIALGREDIDLNAIEWENLDWDSSFQQGGFLNSTSRSFSARSATFRQTLFPAAPAIPSRRKAVTPRYALSTPVEHGVKLVLHIIHAFPQMMLRRQTFPPFIHQHWHTTTLPEKLATCMSIAQLFASRTQETRPFLWRSIDSENQRFRDEMMIYAPHEIIVAMQALVIYTIMAIVDQNGESPPRYSYLARTFKVLTIRFIQLLGTAPFSEAEWANPSLQWEDWIFAESRRRLGCLWFVISRLICPDVDLLCPTLKAARNKPLCTAKGMWEARSREEWETERSFYNASLLYLDMWNFGSLIDAHHGQGPLNTMRLDAWGASTDKMGALLTIAVSLFDKDLDESQTSQ